MDVLSKRKRKRSLRGELADNYEATKKKRTTKSILSETSETSTEQEQHQIIEQDETQLDQSDGEADIQTWQPDVEDSPNSQPSYFDITMQDTSTLSPQSNLSYQQINNDTNTNLPSHITSFNESPILQTESTSSLELPDTTSSPDSTTTRTSLPSFPELYIEKFVAYCPKRENWNNSRIYSAVGTSYLIGKVCSYSRRTKLFLVRWLDSQFHNNEIQINITNVKRGCNRYNIFAKVSGNPDLKALCQPDMDEICNLDDDIENYDEVDEIYSAHHQIPENLDEVEAIKNMRFLPNLNIDEPPDLYKHDDTTTKTRVKPDFVHIFQHSAVASFLAYLPLYFWREVLHQTNLSLAASIGDKNPFQLNELMRFIGILLYMTITNKGEYTNYWGSQAESKIFGAGNLDMENYMSLRRFKLLRQHLSFKYNAETQTTCKDPAAKIRPILNILKVTGSKYVDIGRNVAVDEASVSCRSKFGRHLIVYNPQKPGGKYHFRLYMLCCSTSWIGLNYRLHCESDLKDRLRGVTCDSEAQQLQDELQNVAKVRKHVLEVVRPLYNIKRIINADIFYTSVQLLDALRVKGLYGRGTVRTSSKHFPKHIIMNKKTATRGDFVQAGSSQHRMVAASWCDGSIVTIISNSDASSTTTVGRTVGRVKQQFKSPLCVKEYNSNMQGVDRLDQLRARFSLSDGHSFKKWYKKLAMAMIDIARCNAYLTRMLVCQDTDERDSHRSFVISLAKELITEKWYDAPADNTILYSSTSTTLTSDTSNFIPTHEASSNSANNESPIKTCSAISSRQMFDDSEVSKPVDGSNAKSKYLSKRRRCVVCRWEQRAPTLRTSYCVLHEVALCQEVHPSSELPYVCPDETLTCWQKFHNFYLPRGLYTSKGNLAVSSELYKLKMPNTKRGRVVRQIFDADNVDNPSQNQNFEMRGI